MAPSPAYSPYLSPAESPAMGPSPEESPYLSPEESPAMGPSPEESPYLSPGVSPEESLSPEPSPYASTEPSPYVNPSPEPSPYVPAPTSPYVAPTPYTPTTTPSTPYNPSTPYTSNPSTPYSSNPSTPYSSNPSTPYSPPAVDSPYSPAAGGVSPGSAYGPGPAASRFDARAAEAPFNDFGVAPAPAPGPEVGAIPMCMAEPTCQLFIADSLCCMGHGIIQHAAVKLWMLCSADVYLPEPKCLTVTNSATGEVLPLADSTLLPSDPLLTVNASVVATPNARAVEMGIELPLASYSLEPVGGTAQLAVDIDLQLKRMSEADGLCSLRLRAPCQWEDLVYEAVAEVAPIPVLSVLTAEEASEAGTVLGKPDAVARSDAEAPAPSADIVPPPSISAPLLAADAIGAAPAPSPRREGRRLLLQGGNGRRGLRQEPLLASGGEAPTPAPATLPAPVNPADFAAPEEVRAQQDGLAAALFTIGGDLPTPRVDPGVLPELANVLSSSYTADFLEEGWTLSWVPRNSTSEACHMNTAADLPTDLLLGDVQDIAGFEEECVPANEQQQPL
ncbi:hypothetical protein D9Q98_005121 [Chlorella vulgaris]|uniref:Uncharacterized protein n=1 Tax=Chlorella vulgaris TaxID=3077 RepID=A0A9D4YWZ0_CHLVU|nr:hypothetical protein D9Q98_005121 [Chlorella vulgaris]